jgi:glucose/mannose transport system permease protein
MTPAVLAAAPAGRAVGQQQKARRKIRRIRPHRVAVVAFLTMAAAFFCVPLYVILVTSFKTMEQVRFGEIFSLPQPFTLAAWHYAWLEACSGMACGGISRGFVNSLWILFPSLAMTISLAAVTGYALALWNVRWANGLLFVLFVCAFVPFQIIMYPLIVMAGPGVPIPFSSLKAGLGVYGTTFGIAVVHTVLSLPILTLIFRNFFRGIPNEITAAAMIDSGSFWRIFLEIVLPMSGNILIVVLILMITGIWNDFLVGLTFGGQDSQPMTVMLNNIAYTTTGETNYPVNMAAALLTAAPPLIIYFVLGKFFVQGITAGAIKG